MYRKGKFAGLYVILLIVFSFSAFLLLQPYLKPSPAPPETLSNTFSTHLVFSGISQNLHHPLSLLLLQIIIILAISRTFAYGFSLLGQPPVMGEIVAGIALGPSLLGWALPNISQFIFPPGSLDPLLFLSQIGLLFFMFIVGMELDLTTFKRKLQHSVIISHTGILLSFLAGIAAGIWVYNLFAPPDTGIVEFALFMGMSMSITAFPVMARILQEKGYTRKSFGTMMIGIAAVDDITAWCLLATLIAYIKAGTIVGALPTILLSMGYIAVMFGLIQPFLKKIGNIYVSRENLSRPIVGMIFGIMLVSSYITEIIGIHAFFGAFVAGVIMPPNFRFKKVLSEKFEDLSLVLLLPLFFVFTGLRTEIGLLNNSSLWGIAAAIIGISIAGKFFGGLIGSKMTGHGWKESLMVGALLNSRGLIELIVLNIGYDLGLFSSEIFTILVLMALITTFVAGPSLDFIEWVYKKRNTRKGLAGENYSYKILLSFGPPRMGAALMKIAAAIIGNEKEQSLIKALHMTPNLEITPQEATIFEKEGFAPARRIASNFGLRLQTYYKVSDQIDAEILRKSKKYPVNLLLIGGARSLFTENIVGGRVGNIVQNCSSGLGIFIDKGMDFPSRILILYSSSSALSLVSITQKLSSNPDVLVEVLNLSNLASTDIPDLKSTTILDKRPIDKILLDRYDLLIIDIEYWHKLIHYQTPWLSHCPSTLILSDPKKEIGNVNVERYQLKEI